MTRLSLSTDSDKAVTTTYLIKARKVLDKKSASKASANVCLTAPAVPTAARQAQGLLTYAVNKPLDFGKKLNGNLAKEIGKEPIAISGESRTSLSTYTHASCRYNSPADVRAVVCPAAAASDSAQAEPFSERRYRIGGTVNKNSILLTTLRRPDHE